MKTIALSVLFVIPLKLWSQEPGQTPVHIVEEEIIEPRRDQQQDSNFVCTIVEESAEFPGGVAALKEYLKTNLVYPEYAKEAGVEGKCYVIFTVSEKGKISDIKVRRSVPDCPDCDKEAIRLVKNMPDWKPGRNNGKAVKSYFNLPVTFKLD